jgi:hypothetical protein
MAAKTGSKKLLIFVVLFAAGLVALAITMCALTTAVDSSNSEQENGIDMREDVDEVIFLEGDKAAGETGGSEAPEMAAEPQD